MNEESGSSASTAKGSTEWRAQGGRMLLVLLLPVAPGRKTVATPEGEQVNLLQ